MSVVREQWGSRMGFLLASIGSAVGLGNIWRFNYLAYKWGGGTFILVYIFAILTAALPILILEYGLGHRFRRVAPLSFRRIKRPLELIGWIPAVQMFFIVVYYCVILAWVLNYLYYSLNGALMNAPSTNDFFFKDFIQLSDSVWNLETVVPAILVTLFVVWFLNWIVIIRGLKNGMEFFAKILMPILVLLAIIIIIRGVTLPGSMTGVAAYLQPHWDKLGQPRLWVDAFSQVFFSISAGFGIMIAFASFLPPKTNLVSAGLTVALANSGFFEIILGFGSFGTLGYLAYTKGVALDEVVTSGIGFAFVVFPEALKLLPWAPALFLFLFFLTVFIAGFTSSLSLIEAVVSTIWDKFRISRARITTAICALAFVLGIVFVTKAGLYILDIVDHYITAYILLFVGAAECIVVGWVYGLDKLIAHHDRQPGMKIRHLFGTIVTGLVPVILLIIGYALALTNMSNISDTVTMAGATGREVFWAYVVALWVPLLIAAVAIGLVAWGLSSPGNAEYSILIKFWAPAVLTLIFYQGWFGEFKTAYEGYPWGALAFFGGGVLLHIIVFAVIITNSKGHHSLDQEQEDEEAGILAEESATEMG